MAASAPAKRPLSRRKRLLFAALCTLTATAVSYLAVLLLLSEQLYRYVTSGERAVHGRLFRSDDELGYAVIPGARAESVFPAGPPVPIRIDERGLRVPATPRTAPAGDRALLALGCSFTFGAACRAEHTFAERVGRELGLVVHNAGGNGYGLVQMLRLMRRHAPDLQPGLVLLQYSPWLVTRARSQMAPSYFGRLPVPYFAATADETLDVQGPVFRALVPELPISEHRERGGRLSFYLRCGVPLHVHDHWHVLVSKLAGWPEPERDRRKLVRLCYGELARLGAAQGARCLVVLLGPEEPAAIAELERIAGLELVFAERALRRALPDGDDQGAYERRYGHWRGDPPRLVDTHPNALAHERIAASIVEQLRR